MTEKFQSLDLVPYAVGMIMLVFWVWVDSEMEVGMVPTFKFSANNFVIVDGGWRRC